MTRLLLSLRHPIAGSVIATAIGIESQGIECLFAIAGILATTVVVERIALLSSTAFLQGIIDAMEQEIAYRQIRNR